MIHGWSFVALLIAIASAALLQHETLLPDTLTNHG